MKPLALPPAVETVARRALVAALVLYGIACLRAPEVFRIPDAINLAIHETGHLVFLPFGEFMHFLGGTLFQLLFPLLFVAHFARRGDRFAAYVICWWVAQNLWNVSVYVADARAQLLPLVGGGEHDWAYILGTLELLHLDRRISRTFHFAGVLLFAWAMVMAWLESVVSGRAGDETEVMRRQSAELPAAIRFPATMQLSPDVTGHPQAALEDGENIPPSRSAAPIPPLPSP
jgi:hypothetical protein